MKKLKTCLAFFICCILSLNMVICNVKADNNVVLPYPETDCCVRRR